MIEHKEVSELLTDDWNADRSNRDAGLEDLRFAAGEQWDRAEQQNRHAQDRPCLTINQMPSFIQQVAGEIRQAQPAIEVFPVDSAQDVPVAEIYSGIIRQIEYQSLAGAAYHHAADMSVTCGMGHWRFETVTTDDSVFEQEIKIKRVLDPLSVIWDRGAIEIDRSDALHCFVTEWVPKKGHFNKFGRTEDDFKDIETLTSVEVSTANYQDSGLYWRRMDAVLLAEYWYIDPEERMLVMTESGRTLDITDWSRASIRELANSNQVVGGRKVETPKVFRRLMDGSDWLDEPKEWAGKYIPVVPVLGAEIAYEGTIARKGLVRDAKDSQKYLNIVRTAAAERIASSPNAKFMGTTEMFKGRQTFWENAHRSISKLLVYNKTEDNASPVAVPPPPLEAALLQEGQVANEDMQRVTSVYDAARGGQGREISGAAIDARVQQTNTGNVLFMDNFMIAMQRSGMIMVDLIPRIYDTDRNIMILGPDSREMYVPINRYVMGDRGEPVLVNDLSNGRFNVRVKAGQSYVTQRAEAKEQMSVAMQGNPELWAIFGDLFFENSDYPGAKEIAERMRKFIKPEMLEEGEPQPDPMQQLLQALGIQKEQAEVKLLEASADQSSAQAAKTFAEAQLAPLAARESLARGEKTAVEAQAKAADAAKTVAETEQTEIETALMPIEARDAHATSQADIQSTLAAARKALADAEKAIAAATGEHIENEGRAEAVTEL